MALPLILAGAAVGSSLLSGIFGASAASKAAKAQAEANRYATDESRRQFDEQMAQYQKEQAAAAERYGITQTQLSPYITSGASALESQRALAGIGMSEEEKQAKIADANAEYEKVKQDKERELGLMGGVSVSSFSPRVIKRREEYNKALSEADAKRQATIEAINTAPSGAEAQRAAIGAIEASPEMQYLTKQGESAIMSNASATGGLRGGNVQGALAQFRPSLLNDLIKQQYSRLGQLSQLGQSSIVGAPGYGGGGTNYPSGAGIVGGIEQGGAIQAGSELAKGAAWQTIPNAFMTGLGTYAGLGGFNTTGNYVSGDVSKWKGTQVVPGYMKGSYTSPF